MAMTPPRSHARTMSPPLAPIPAINPVVALELLSRGTWTGAGVLGPEAFDAVPFLDLLTEYGSPWGQQELAIP